MESKHPVEWLRKIQVEWGLSQSELARIAHVEEGRLAQLFSMGAAELADQPSIPTGLEPAMSLIGLFRLLQGPYPTSGEQLAWLERPNAILEGRKPIEVIVMSAEHLAYVAYTVESGLRLSPT